ncbi:MAG TPA: PAS domain-containing protein [Parvularculaceae bacterium]|nr:PAS domain-containing protein [Parvularculaceae bacterium]
MIFGLQTAISNTPSRRPVENRLSAADRVKIRAERMALLMRGAPVAIAVTIVNVMITLAIARESVEAGVLVAWAGLVLFLAGAMFAIWLRHSRPAAPAHGLVVYSRVHIAWMGLNGVLWGALAPIFAVHGLLGNAFLPFMIAGMTAAALASAASSWRSVLAFNVPALAPFAFVYAFSGGAIGPAIAAIVGIYAVATAYLAWTSEQMIMRSIRLRSRNDRLLDALKKQVDAAHEAEKRYRALVESSQDVTLIFSPEGAVVYASPSIATALGAPAQHMIGRTTKDLLHPDDFALFRAVGERSLSTLGEVIPLPHVCLKSSEGEYIAFAGRLTNMLYVPGVEGFVFSGGRLDGRARLHAAE